MRNSEMLRRIIKGRKLIITLVVPFLLLPIPLIIRTKAADCGFVVLLMSVFWMTEALPLAVTALFPMIFFPAMGILSSQRTSETYFDETTAMFLGSLIAAAAVEHCNLHNRIALKVLLVVGTTPKWLLLGMMVTPTVLSMWISNTATAVLMVPVVEAILKQLSGSGPDQESIQQDETVAVIKLNTTSTNKCVTNNQEAQTKHLGNVKKAIYLGICYASNIGGTGSITGSPPNLVFKGLVEKKYPNYKALSFSSWLIFNVPGVVLSILLAWGLLLLMYMRNIKTDKGKSKEIRQMIKEKYSSLGQITFHEFAVTVLFTLLLLLWFFRDPEFLTGWGRISNSEVLTDPLAAFAIIVVMFVIPAKPRQWYESPALLDWKVVHEKIPWGVVLLVGGSMVLAEGVEESGLSKWLGGILSSFQSLPHAVLVLVVSIIALVVTEVASNTATTSIMLPVLAELAEVLHIHPISIMLPVTVSCSYAFILPVATAPNAIIAASADIGPKDMAPCGLIMKFICLGVMLLMVFTLGPSVFDFNNLQPFGINNSSSILPASHLTYDY